MTVTPVLDYPTRDDNFDTDASDQGIEALLSQFQDGKKQAVVCYITLLCKAERITA